jgi:hypothetical protein
MRRTFILYHIIIIIKTPWQIIEQQGNTRHFLIPWTGGAFAPLGPFFCPTTEEKKWPIAPRTCIE